MTENELLELLAKELALPEMIEDDEVTVQMLADRIGISLHTSKKKLEKMVKAGRLECRQARVKSGSLVVAYRKKE